MAVSVTDRVRLSPCSHISTTEAMHTKSTRQHREGESSNFSISPAIKTNNMEIYKSTPVTCFRAYVFIYVFATLPHTAFPHLITVNTAVFFFQSKAMLCTELEYMQNEAAG